MNCDLLFLLYCRRVIITVQDNVWKQKWETWFDMGGADGSFGLQCIFNVECTIAMMSLSGMCWRDVAGRSCSYIYIYIYMIGQIFKALLELVFSFLGNSTILWWAQFSPFDRRCTVHLQYRLYFHYKHVSLCSEDGHYISTQLVFWRSVIPTQRQNIETCLTLSLHY